MMSKLQRWLPIRFSAVSALAPLITFPVLFPVSASAQETARLQGMVAEEGTGRAIGSAVVTLVGTNVQARTGPDGIFTFSELRVGPILIRVQAPGYPTVVNQVTVHPDAVVLVQLPVSDPAAVLDEILVTQSPKPQPSDEGVARTAADLVARHVPHLQGFTDGFSSARGRALSPRVQPRGTSSFSANAEPVIVLDGARLRGGIDVLRQIPATQIKSIRFLKGPTAAFLYGSAAGVIYIQTESGPPPPP